MSPAASPTKTYHIWFSTKHRKEALQGEIGDFAAKSIRDVAARSGCHIVEMECAFDHVHLMVALPAERTLSSAMHQLKGASARAVFLEFPELRLDLASSSFWQKGYGYRLVPPQERESVRRYIRTQDERRLRHE